MTKMTLLPTGRCFDDVVEYINEEFKRKQDAGELERQYVIVHGICLGRHVKSRTREMTKNPEFYSHAWLLWLGDTVIDFGLTPEGDMIRIAQPVDAFLHARNVYETWTYTIAEAALASQQGLASGPYNYRLYQLCGDFDNQVKAPFMDKLGEHAVLQEGAPR